MSERACEWSERASKASVGKWSAAEQVSGVNGATKQIKLVTEWPVQKAIVTSRNRPSV